MSVGTRSQLARGGLAGLIVALALASCGPPGADPAAADDALRLKVDRLEADLIALSRSSTENEGRLRVIERKLSDATDRLEQAMRRLESALAGAEADAAGALERAESAARSLAVLTDRYDYHLRRYHGDG
ncbi:MAG TPA: hypothetical protein VNC78_04720 [Actinomycetota bacterium]|nr:hypothetical protein [Actinomycetota bacterium]